MSLSVVAPVYNEASVLAELARRCADAALLADADAEVLLVDDASTDGSALLLDTLGPPVRPLRLPHNQGQLRATLAGLRAARGDVVVVIDGDLQDPPELIGTLVAALRATPDADVAFAVKVGRDDPLWFRVGRAGFAALLAVPGARAVPPGAGAYCAMRAPLAARAAAAPVPDANLAPLLVALGARAVTVPYVKAARYDGVSRVGPLGLIREALPSLALTGALSAWLAWAAVVAAGIGLASARPAGLAAAVAAGAAAALVRRWARQVLAGAPPQRPGAHE